MAPMQEPASHLFNALAEPSQLQVSRSEDDGVPADLVASVIFGGARLTQTAGVLLRLPQDVVAQAIVLFTRFWIGENGFSLYEYDAEDLSAASVYLASKVSDSQKSLRSVINVYAYLHSFPHTFTPAGQYAEGSSADTYHVSEGTFERRRLQLTRLEMQLLQTFGLDIRVALPHTLCINYLQTLGLFQAGSGQAVAKRTFAHLNSALLNPQLLYLVHQPSALATAAIYLASKEIGVKLPGDEWWEVFDTDREELGFIVVALLSMEGFVRFEKEKWEARKIPLTVKELREEVRSRN